MAHIGAVCPGVAGHLNPTAALASELRRRGHRVTTFQVLDAENAARQRGMEFYPMGRTAFPPGSVNDRYTRLGKLQGLPYLRYLLGCFVENTEMVFAEGPDALRRAGIDLLMVDQIDVSWACVCDRAGLPYVTLSNALVFNQEPCIPPFFTDWAYRPGAWARARNRLANHVQWRLTRAWWRRLNAWRRDCGLPLYRRLEDSTSRLAHVCQQPACFDFPRRTLPPQLHYTGPWHDPALRAPAPFPMERLNGAPLIYASMGTLHNGMPDVFRRIAQACAGLPAQLVISLGGGSTPEEVGTLPGDPIVVPFAPQLDLLPRAALTITHAGLNTTLESLSCGTPMVAIPAAGDQPGVAARIRWLGVGEAVLLTRLTARRLRPLVERVLSHDSYRRRASELRVEIAAADGLRKAADIVEGALAGSAAVRDHRHPRTFTIGT